jgi:hypothetical protein
VLYCLTLAVIGLKLQRSNLGFCTTHRLAA